MNQCSCSAPFIIDIDDLGIGVALSGTAHSATNERYRMANHIHHRTGLPDSSQTRSNLPGLRPWSYLFK